MTKVIKIDVIKPYIALTKPGIIRGNLLTCTAGFFLAANGHSNLLSLCGVLLGTSLIVASACVCNNYIDRDIDAKMHRTKQRALVQGTISPRTALLYAGLLGIVGALSLARLTNALTVAIGLVGFITYVFMYSRLKTHSLYAAHVGSIAGAVPPVAGYCTVTSRLDAAAVILFFILTCWQMAHFFAIALYRQQEYAAAGVPVLPVARGPHTTRLQIIVYILLYILASCLLTVSGNTGFVYLGSMIGLGLLWLRRAHLSWNNSDVLWGRSIFVFSLIIISLQSILLIATRWLP